MNEKPQAELAEIIVFVYKYACLFYGVIVVAIKSLLSFSEYDASSSRSKSLLHLLTGSIPVCVGVQFTVQDIELVSIVGFPVAPRAGR